MHKCLKVKKTKNTIFIVLLIAFLINVNYSSAQPPACTISVDVSPGNMNWIPQVSRTLNSGDVLCISGNGTYFGTITARSGSHVVICGNVSIFGSVNINANAHYWKTATTGFTGSLTMNGILHTGASSCSGGGPLVDDVTASSRCGAGSVALRANVSAGSSVRWYAAAVGGGILGTSSDGGIWNTPAISVTTTYFAEAWNGAASSSARTTVIATVKANPFIHSVAGGVRAGRGTVVLSAAVSAGSFALWYSTNVGGSLLKFGNPYTTDTLAVSTTYYVEAWDFNGCRSGRVPVLAQVGTLPIELLSFSALKNGKSVLLQWVTGSEINNDYFTVEKSVDGVRWEIVGSVDGAGNSSSTKSYSLSDNSQISGKVYYRLKQTDYDEKYVYSDIRQIERRANDDENKGFVIFPNPLFGNQFYINMPFSEEEQEVFVTLFNSQGQKVYSKMVVQNEGSTITTITLSTKLKAGIYMLVGLSDYDEFRKRLIIQ